MRRAALGLLLAAALPLLGCGGGSSSQGAVRAAMRDYVSALYGRDAGRLCERLAPAMIAAYNGELPATLAPGKPCRERLAAAFDALPAAPGAKVPKYSIERVSVRDAKASAAVRLPTRTVPFQLVRTASGRWLVACCVGAQRDKLPAADYRVPSGSMEPTLKLGAYVAVDQRAYATAPPQIGDVVVFHPPGNENTGCADANEGHAGARPCSRAAGGDSPQRFVMRVVAGPGDRIALRAGRAVRNGSVADEPFIKPCESGTECDFPLAVVVPPGSFYVLGDNRGAANDSRFFGPVRRTAILGRVKTG